MKKTLAILCVAVVVFFSVALPVSADSGEHLALKKVEIYNANRTDFENRQAEIFCENYGLIPFAGSDNHAGAAQWCAFDYESRRQPDHQQRIHI